MLNSFHYSNESTNVYIQLRIRFHLNRLSSCLTTIYGLNEIKSKWILTWKKIWARLTVLCFLYLSPKEKIIALNRYIPIFDRSYFNTPSLNQPDETKQQQQVENQPISRLFFRNEAIRWDRARTGQRSNSVDERLQARWHVSLRVTRDRCRLVVVTWDAKKKTKRENKILFLRSSPSPHRRRHVTHVKVWLTTELTIDATGEVRILRPST